MKERTNERLEHENPTRGMRYCVGSVNKRVDEDSAYPGSGFRAPAVRSFLHLLQAITPDAGSASLGPELLILNREWLGFTAIGIGWFEPP